MLCGTALTENFISSVAATRALFECYKDKLDGLLKEANKISNFTSVVQSSAGDLSEFAWGLYSCRYHHHHVSLFCHSVFICWCVHASLISSDVWTHTSAVQSIPFIWTVNQALSKCDLHRCEKAAYAKTISHCIARDFAAL